MTDPIKPYQKKVWQAMQYIEQNLEQSLDLEVVASKVFISKFHFHRIFKIISGESVASYIRRIRLEKTVHNIFSCKDKSITDIAIAAGFSSSQNFAKVFQKQFGLAPSQIRQCEDFQQLNLLLRKNSKNGNAPFDYPDYYRPVANQQENIMDLITAELSEQRVAYIRAIGAYGTVEEAAYGKLMAWAGPQGLLETQSFLSICWDNPEITPAEKCRTDVCITIEPEVNAQGDVLIQTIPAGKYAQVRRTITDKSQFKKAWDEVVAGAMEQSMQISDNGPCFEFYHSASPDGVFDVTFNLAVN